VLLKNAKPSKDFGFMLSRLIAENGNGHLFELCNCDYVDNT